MLRSLLSVLAALLTLAAPGAEADDALRWSELPPLPDGLLTVLEFMGLLGGTLSGLFVVGIFSRRANSRGALAGAVLSAAIVFSVRLTRPLNVYAYAPIGLTACVAIGWLCGSWRPAPRSDLQGLTMHTMGKSSSVRPEMSGNS